jgi:hypothetical protein
MRVIAVNNFNDGTSQSIPESHLSIKLDNAFMHPNQTTNEFKSIDQESKITHGFRVVCQLQLHTNKQNEGAKNTGAKRPDLSDEAYLSAVKTASGMYIDVCMSLLYWTLVINNTYKGGYKVAPHTASS